MKKTLVIAAVTLAVGSFSLLAQDGDKRPGGPGRPHPGEIFKDADKNGDGKLSKDEAPDRLKENFDKIDADKDGFITKDELATHFKSMGGDRPGGPGGPGGPDRPNPGEAFKKMDKNGDGKLSKDEAPDRLKENFDKVDADKDGFITKEEMAEHFKSQGGDRRPDRKDGPGGRPTRPGQK